MKKVFHYACLLIGMGGLLSLSSCGSDPEPTATLPEPDGNVQINFLNFPGTGNVTTTAAAGDFLSVAVQVQKTASGNRPQKLRVYETFVLGTRGTPVGSTIDLRNVDDPQIKNVNYTVPSTLPVYLYFEVDESGGKFSRKLLTITTGAATINSYTGLVLGAQTNSAESRLSSATGQLYSSCNTAANIGDIDITYASIGSPTSLPTILSNPERQVKGLSTNATGCGDNASSSTAGGPKTVFLLAPTADFANATDATLEALNMTGATESVTVAAGNIIAFRRTDGKKGLIKVNSIPNSSTAGTINIDVKVQR